ncbi:DUF6612 family protein [Alkalihalobacterium alkalinitrilicum]|uniref:DUF6612 family protein n=1 Tax=Alkalihalobacterium alkalinitrilicum TaxID=427920 RepID=UPI000995C0BB|nr:DUF6612 family protein [Alkalihalobacterium alkalinitrilicum]
MRFIQVIIFYVLLGVIGTLTACQLESEQLAPEEVLKHSIEVMREVHTYAFELDSISSESDMGTMTAHISGSSTVSPLHAHIKRTSRVAASTMKTEAYIIEDETYFLMDDDKDLWINVSPEVGTVDLVEEMELILEYIDLFHFTEDKNGYRFSISTDEEEMNTLWTGLFPFFYVFDDPLFHTMMQVIRLESGPSYLNYEMVIDKESFYRTSAMMEYAYDMNLTDDGSENKLTETLYMTYHSMNEVDEVIVPKTVIENARTYGEILFGNHEAEEEQKLFTHEKKGNSDGNHMNGSYFATDGVNIYYSNWMQESGIYKLADDGIEKELISDVLAVDLNVTEDWIYYSDEKDGFNVYRMSKDGSDVEKISSDYAIDLRVVDEWLFYKTNNPLNNNQPLYMVHSKDGVKLQIVDNLFRYTVYEDQVLYQKEPQGNLYLLEIDEMRQTYPQMLDYSVRRFIVEAGWIYFESAVDDGKIYRVRLDGTQVEQLTRDESQGFNVVDETLYFTNVSEGHSLYQLDLNTLESAKLDERGSHIHIINDRLYYSKHISGLELGWFQMNLDGSKAERAPF